MVILSMYVLCEVNLIGQHGCYSSQGDINLGISMFIHESGDGDELCGQKLSHRTFLEAIFSMAYAVKNVNRDPSLLPNITIGFTVLDDCGKDTAALARAMAFVNSDQNCDKLKNEHLANGNRVECCAALNDNPVKGVIGPVSSRQSIMAASLYSLYEIPTLSPTATSDELDDRSRFGYFLRLVPSDRFQAQAMLAFYEAMNWTYSALIYSEGGYGENGAKQIQNEVNIYNI